GTEGMNRMGGEAGQVMWRNMTPLGRMGTVAEIGGVAAFLATPLARYISGARITVDGGQNLTGSSLFNATIAEQLGTASRPE
ncbi:SDR family oxidoreductase, partial [Vibrio parahaemolyticus]